MTRAECRFSVSSAGFMEDEHVYQPLLRVRRCALLVSLATLGKSRRDLDVHVILDNDYCIAQAPAMRNAPA